jgi:hypothetical protein
MNKHEWGLETIVDKTNQCTTRIIDILQGKSIKLNIKKETYYLQSGSILFDNQILTEGCGDISQYTSLSEVEILSISNSKILCIELHEF